MAEDQFTEEEMRIAQLENDRKFCRTKLTKAKKHITELEAVIKRLNDQVERLRGKHE